MIILKATTETLQFTSSAAATGIDFSVSYADITSTAFTPSTNEGKSTASSTQALLSAPAASTQRQVKLITLSNIGTLSSAIIVQKVISAVTYNLTPTVTLLVGETLQYMDGIGWNYYGVGGALKAAMTAAGTTGQVQINENNQLDGDIGLTYDINSDILGIVNTTSSINLGLSPAGITTTVPGANILNIFARNVANRGLLGAQDQFGTATSYQPILARNKVGYWNPPGNATTVPGIFGIPALTGQGTATMRTVTTTNLANRMRRIGYPSTATAGTFAGARLAQAMFSPGSGTADGSGFTLIERWVESDAAVVSGRRAFHGMTSNTGAFTNVEVNTLTNLIGVCQLSTDATQWYWIGAGSAAQSAIAMGTAVGAPAGNSTTAWELAVYAPNSLANTYYVQLTNITTGVVASHTFSGAATVVPQSSTLLSWNAWATNNATALAVGIDICSIYIETDN
jgi:hypothetical protein